jgi:rfaE bifunctional protein kinase chain/domain
VFGAAVACQLEQLIRVLSSARVLVFGDLILDHFVRGRVSRLSPEAPVPILDFEEDEYRLGGAANVAFNIRSLQATPVLCGVTGDDESSSRLRCELAFRGISDTYLIRDKGRRTTTKTRLVTTQNRHVARFDYESRHDLDESLEREVSDRIMTALGEADVVLISDYAKGSVTRAVATTICSEAGRRGIPVLVDPKVRHADRYRGAYLVTPNQSEAEQLTGIEIRTDDDAGRAARAFSATAGTAGTLVTRGERGMTLVIDRTELHLPAYAREVADVTGAGDTVIATIAAALGAGAAVTEAVGIANIAAGISVSRFGPAVVTARDITDWLRIKTIDD